MSEEYKSETKRWSDTQHLVADIIDETLFKGKGHVRFVEANEVHDYDRIECKDTHLLVVIHSHQYAVAIHYAYNPKQRGSRVCWSSKSYSLTRFSDPAKIERLKKEMLGDWVKGEPERTNVREVCRIDNEYIDANEKLIASFVNAGVAKKCHDRPYLEHPKNMHTFDTQWNDDHVSFKIEVDVQTPDQFKALHTALLNVGVIGAGEN